MTPVDSEELSLDDVLNLAYSRGCANFKDENLAQTFAIAVAGEFTRLWPDKKKKNLDRDNPASFLDKLISLHGNDYKKEFIEQHLQQKKALSREDFWLWFIEDLLEYAKNHPSPYMASAMLMVLCDYQSPKVFTLYGYLAKSRGLVDDSIFRDDKRPMLRPFKEARYGKFRQFERVGTTERYVKEKDIKSYRDWFEKWLQQLTPLRPDCLLKDGFNLYEMEKLYIRYTATDYPGHIERNRRHIMECPKCLTKLLNALGFDPWPDSFAPPAITLRGPDSGNDGPTSGRTDMRTIDPTVANVVKTTLGKQSIRRQRLSPRSLFVGIDSQNPQKVLPNQQTKLYLKDGDSAIRVSGKDRQGSLPVDTHFISWNEDLIEDRRATYITNLNDNRRLEFEVTYEPDDVEGFRGARVNVSYVLEPEAVLIPGLRTVLASVAIVISVCLFFLSWPSTSLRLLALTAAALVVALSVWLFWISRYDARHGIRLAVVALIVSCGVSVMWYLRDTPPIPEVPIASKSYEWATTATVKVEPPPPADNGKFDTQVPPVPIDSNLDNRPSEEPPPAQPPNFSTQHPEERQRIPVLAVNNKRQPGGGRSASNGASVNTDAGVVAATNRGALKRKVTLKQDQIIQVEVIDRIGSRFSLAGSFFRTRVLRAVYVGGEPVVPKKTVAMGYISRVTTGAQGAVRDSMEVHLVMLELRNQTTRIDGELLSSCPEQTSVAIQPRPKVAFVGDEKRGAIIAPVPERPVKNHSTGAVPPSPAGQIDIKALVEPGKEPAIKVCFALKKSVSVFPPSPD